MYTTKTNQLKEVAPMRKVLVCLTVLVGLVLSLGLTASAESVRKILVIEKDTKEEVIALVEQLGGTVVNELEKIEGSLIVDIPVAKEAELRAAREILKVYDDEVIVFVPPWRHHEASVKKEEEERPRLKQLEQYTGNDWGYDRIDVEEIHWPGVSRMIHGGSIADERSFASLPFILIGVLGLVGAGLSRRRGWRGLFLAFAFAGLSLFVTGCVGTVSLIEGAGIRVALLDTGIDFEHPDLNANINVGLSRNCLTGTCVPGGDDDNGHGTWTGGIIAAERRNEADKPFDKKIGVAPRAELVAIKVCDSGGSCPSSAILAGMNYAVAVGAKVASMSLGSGTFARGGLATSCEAKPGDPSGTGTGMYDPALRAMFVNNLTLVVAAGNHGGNIGPTALASLFASCRGTIAVAATTPADRMACTSFRTAYGDDVELAAPGDYVFSGDLMPPAWEGYSTGSGTSASAPYTAGVAALLYSIGINTPTAVRTKLIATADNVIQPCGTIMPEPILDAEEAVLGTQNGDN